MPNSPVETVIEQINLCRQARQSLTYWGHTGGAKSQIVALAAERGIGETIKIGDDEYPLPMGLVDFRCSQLEGGDVGGLPDKDMESKRTVYFPPAMLPVGDMSAERIHKAKLELDAKWLEIISKASTDAEKAEAELNFEHETLKFNKRMARRYQHGILFLDEVNRAGDDVLQAIFELIHDRTIKDYVLPPGWCIVMACNFMEGGSYIVNNFRDDAFIARSCHVLFPSGDGMLPDWISYMVDTHGIARASRIIELVSANLDFLEPHKSGDLGFTIQPSKRKWDQVARVLEIAHKNNYSELATETICAGLIGQSTWASYRDYSCPVPPAEILAKGANVFKEELSQLNRNQLLSVCWGVISHCKDKYNSDKAMKTCVDLAHILITSSIVDKDVVLAFCRNTLALHPQSQQLMCCITGDVEFAKHVLANMEDDQPFLRHYLGNTELCNAIRSVGWSSN